MSRIILLIFIFFPSLSIAQMNWKEVSNKNFNRAVVTLYSDSVADKLFIGGHFRFYDTLSYKGVAQWDGINITSLDCGLGGCSSVDCGGVIEFEKFNGELYALFIEDSIGCQNVHHIAKWNGLNWISLNQNFFLGSNSTTIYSMVSLDSHLIVSGGFDSVLTKKVQGIVKYDGTNWDTIFSCNLFTDDNLLVHPLIKYNNSIYAQNHLIDTLGSRQLFSRWNGQCWEKVQNAFSNGSGGIRKMIVYKNELYIAGAFDQNHDPQAPGKSIARWNGIRWDDLSGGVQFLNPNYTAYIEDMAIFDNELYVVGNFQKAGSLSASNIAKWDGNSWCTLNSQFDSEITSIAFYHDSIFVGGNFRKIDNDSIYYFAKSSIGNFDTCEFNIGINEFDKDNFVVYPIPAMDKLYIEISGSIIQRTSILDISGKISQLIFCDTSKTEVDISSLASGIYFIEAITDQGIFRKKFVKN